MEDIKMKAEQIANDLANAKSEVATLKSEVESKAAELAEAKSCIDNLDASIKDQQKTIDELRIEVKANKNVDFKSEFRAALTAQKDTIAKMMQSKAGRFMVNIEMKSVVSIGVSTAITGNGIGLQSDPAIHAANPSNNVFIATFGLRPRTANKLSWLEATKQNAADYVGELAQNTNKSDIVFTEKTRQYGKIATFMTISTEVEDWFEQIYNFCVNEGARMVEDKIDAEIYGGNGNDSSNPTHIYGLKDSATPFAALAANAVANANVADVLMDAADQIAKEGFRANVAFVTWPVYRQLREIKSTTGDYLLDRVSGMLNGVIVKPTSHMSAGDMLVVDSNCVECYAGNSYELEFDRNAEYDAYNVYFRKAAQTKVSSPKKKGLVYVASVTTAIAALLSA